MIYLHEFIDYPADSNLKIVLGVHMMPFDPTYGLGKTQEELEQTGVLVEALPTVEVPLGKCKGNLLINLSTKVMQYEIIDEVVAEGLAPTWAVLVKENEQLKAENSSMKQQITDLNLAMAAIMGGTA